MKNNIICCFSFRSFENFNKHARIGSCWAPARSSESADVHSHVVIKKARHVLEFLANGKWAIWYAYGIEKRGPNGLIRYKKRHGSSTKHKNKIYV